jgi:hypothetical protein
VTFAGVDLALAVLGVVMTEASVAADPDLHELLPLLSRLISSSSLTAACEISLLPPDLPCGSQADEDAMSLLANMLQHSPDARLVAAESRLLRTLATWLSKRAGASSAVALHNALQCMVCICDVESSHAAGAEASGTDAPDAGTLGSRHTEQVFHSAEFCSDVLMAVERTAAFAAADAANLIAQHVGCSDQEAEGAPRTSGVGIKGCTKEELQQSQLKAQQVLAVILHPVCSAEALAFVVAADDVASPHQQSPWRRDALAAAMRVLQGKGRAPDDALEASLKLLQSMCFRLGPLGLLRAPQGDALPEKIEERASTQPALLLATFIRVETFSFLQKLSLEKDRATELLASPGLREECGVFFLCLELCDALVGLLADPFERLGDGKPEMSSGGPCSQSPLHLVAVSALSEDFMVQVSFASVRKAKAAC